MKEVKLFLLLFFSLIANMAFASVPDPNIININNDSRINFIDFSSFASNWLLAGAGLTGDFDDSNLIDINDLYEMSYYWLQEFPKTGYSIIAWGRDTEGQVSGAPDGNDFIDVAAGKYHAMALKNNGTLMAWGLNDKGQCNTPPDNNFIAIACGAKHSLALKSDGTLAAWGDNTYGEINVPPDNNFVAIACGDYHSIAIANDGNAVCWGQNIYGQCDACRPDMNTTFISVSAGRYHSLALQSNGKIKAWGDNSKGQTTIYNQISYYHDAIAAADTYNFVLLNNNTLISWGGGDFIEPGIPDYHYLLTNGTDFVAIAAGTVHVAALTANGQIFCWNYNDFGYASSPVSPVPTGVIFTKDIEAGYNFTVALKY